MYIVLLKFSVNRANAAMHMQGHNAWLERGFEDGVFLLAGSLQPGQGGAVIAKGLSLPELKARLEEDPFVSENIVSTEILEISPGRTDERLAFLLE